MIFNEKAPALHLSRFATLCLFWTASAVAIATPEHRQAFTARKGTQGAVRQFTPLTNAQRLSNPSRNALYGYGISVGNEGRIEDRLQQRVEIKRFLRKVHHAMQGAPIRYFDKVKLVATGGFTSSIRLDVKTNTLLLWVPKEPVTGRLKIMRSREIERLWDRGAAVGVPSLSLGKMGRYKKALWQLGNPIGTPRVLLRRTIKEQKNETDKQLSELLQCKTGREIKPKLIAFLRTHVDPQAKTQKGANALEEVIKTINHPKTNLRHLRRFTTNMRHYLGQGETIAGLADAVFQASLPKENEWMMKQTMQGFGVQVMTYHQVFVNANIALGLSNKAHLSHRAKNFESFVTVEQGMQKPVFEQLSKGGVQVLATDNILVNADLGVNVQYQRSLPTAAMLNAYAQTASFFPVNKQ